MLVVLVCSIINFFIHILYMKVVLLRLTVRRHFFQKSENRNIFGIFRLFKIQKFAIWPIRGCVRTYQWSSPPVIAICIAIWRATNVDVNTCHWYFHDFLWFSALWKDILYGFSEEQQKLFFWKPPNFIDKYSGCGFNGPLWTMHEKSKKKWNYDRY